MPNFRPLIGTVLLAALFSQAHPAPSSASTEHHQVSARNVFLVGKRGVQIEAFHPPSTYETFGTDGPELMDSLFKRQNPRLDEESAQYVATKLKVDRKSVRYRSGFSSGSLRYAYLRQHANGIPFANAVANVAFKGKRVVSFGSSFVKPRRVASPTPSIDLKSVLPAVEETLDGKYNRHPTHLEYLARPDGSASPIYVAQIQNDEENTWYEAFIDAHSGELLSVINFKSHATYLVLPFEKQSLPEGVELLTDPQDTFSSPQGWHTPGAVRLATEGNNAIAFKGTQDIANLTVAPPSRVFSFPYDVKQPANYSGNVDAARVNAFYLANKIHDFSYRYGFTEAAFNFQNDNFGKGGQGNDRVTISIQDAGSVNNADFTAPPDGQNGRCRMYIWTDSPPTRDGAMQNDIMVHEMTHGLTVRLTGGGSSRCLQTLEAAALGEGWSDALTGWVLRQGSEEVPDWVLAPWASAKPGRGLRTRPYSTNTTVNPLVYSNAGGLPSPHPMGEVWANILYNIYAALLTRYGWSPTAMTDPDRAEGNVVWLHLFIDSLSLLPCQPTFPNARDGWIQADANRYGGVNRCLLWREFARRGMGVNAVNFANDFSVPEDCEDESS